MEAKSNKALLLKVSAYYAAVVVVIWLIAIYFPHWLKVLPFGGLDQFENSATTSTVIDLGEIKLYEQPHNLFGDSLNLITAMLGVFIIMTPVRWIYLNLADTKTANPAIASGLFLLPMVVTAIVAIVQFSLALAFALTGIFAGVRYRTTIKSLSDAFFTFAAIGVGLAAGTRSLGIALVLAVFFSIAVILYPPIQNPPGRNPENQKDPDE